ncbi:Oidioi.mRNA.OKI2018_I69.chr2.g4759.t2.cds [Oikopleura dioica]|uniref:Oidioi.mRNA.OKI2018_I69.chr2.g4759.t2.cds n=1 Tax=Oikopleura dioica TaxID=34765 RepID=A0ABN7SY28_OIKDI|nr:Oidioi.mRNA.OKI2018_I69.chr2.g4759.t2.cds [Oikopleura dioica]
MAEENESPTTSTSSTSTTTTTTTITTTTTTTTSQTTTQSTTTTTQSTTTQKPAPELAGFVVTVIEDSCKDANSSETIHYRMRICDCTLTPENRADRIEELPVAFKMIPTNNYAVSWAWASFMLHLCISAFFALMWNFQVRPAITPPYNKAVLAMFLCLLALIIIDCCGMSKYIVRENPHPTASASLCFNMFLFFFGSFVAMGAYQERDTSFDSQQFS